MWSLRSNHEQCYHVSVFFPTLLVILYTGSNRFFGMCILILQKISLSAEVFDAVITNTVTPKSLNGFSLILPIILHY